MALTMLIIALFRSGVRWDRDPRDRPRPQKAGLLLEFERKDSKDGARVHRNSEMALVC